MQIARVFLVQIICHDISDAFLFFVNTSFKKRKHCHQAFRMIQVLFSIVSAWFSSLLPVNQRSMQWLGGILLVS